MTLFAFAVGMWLGLLSGVGLVVWLLQWEPKSLSDEPGDPYYYGGPS